ncbi:hypothetical protein [Halomontanus rarus]|uniref:hypothetical protein n=1 Tax=Halomontanus rarus TaxID=3034020 RepID=UPI00307BF980
MSVDRFEAEHVQRGRNRTGKRAIPTSVGVERGGSTPTERKPVAVGGRFARRNALRRRPRRPLSTPATEAVDDPSSAFGLATTVVFHRLRGLGIGSVRIRSRVRLEDDREPADERRFPRLPVRIFRVREVFE